MNDDSTRSFRPLAVKDSVGEDVLAYAKSIVIRRQNGGKADEGDEEPAEEDDTSDTDYEDRDKGAMRKNDTPGGDPRSSQRRQSIQPKGNHSCDTKLVVGLHIYKLLR